MHTLPEYLHPIIHRLDTFVAERAKTARHFIKASGMPRPISELHISELNKRTEQHEIANMLQPIVEGKDIGLMSEAGCPGVADPGAELVKIAHERGIQVVPLVGPSSILLALMASGMNGQSFSFHGYLSPKRPELGKDLKRLEQLAHRHKQTQLFIETPYRNTNVVEEALKHLAGHTRLGIAADITLASEYIKVATIKDWKKGALPDLHKRPAIFMIA